MTGLAEVDEKLTPEQEELLRKQAYVKLNHYTYWLASMVHRNTRRKPLDFSIRPELIPIYMDDAQEMTVIKSVQCGISEYLVVYTLGMAEKGLSIFYVMPTIPVKHRFVQNRINPLFASVPYYKDLLRSAVGETDNLSMKHFGKGTIIFCGSNSPNDFIEFPADAAIIDELDFCDHTNLEKADDRLTASEHKIKKQVSNPTVVDYGIDAEFQYSDQKHYYFKCGCGHRFTPNWFEHVVREVANGIYEMRDPEEKDVICNKCERPIDRSIGEWVAHNPGVDISGYRISKLISPLHDLRKLFLKFVKARRSDVKMQVFFNSDLGLAYSGRGVEVTIEMLEALCGDYWMDENLKPTKRPLPTTMGVDVGNWLHIVIRDLEPPRTARFIGELQTFDQVKDLIPQYNVVSSVVDALPETREAARFRDSVGEAVWLCYYLSNNSNEPYFNEEKQELRVDRTFALDGIFGRNGDVALGHAALINPRNASTLCEGSYYRHMRDPVRIFDPDRGTFVYRSRTDEDHFAHAENYCKLATQAPDMGYTGDIY